MKNIFKLNKTFKVALFAALGLVVMSSLYSCDFEYDLPETNSIADLTPPTAYFTYVSVGEDYQNIKFSNLSSSATTFLWDFGGGATSTDENPTYTFTGGVGSYPVKLTASDANGESSTITIDVKLVDVFMPINPTILNGDFNLGATNWDFTTFTGGTTSPFNTSGDGSWLAIDGNSTGAKTAGAKWTKSTSAGAYLSSSSRYAYQAITVSPTKPFRTVKYTLEYEYAIKTPTEQSGEAPGGNRIIAEILGGQFTDGANAIVSSNAGPLARHIGTEVLGKTTFTTVKIDFTSNATGLVSILIYGVTAVDSYVDNVKVYPKR
ncbi:MAG: PKD domain-containing protein [Gelidibacter sp.]|nr:PKD domain-containing protein [Gelidibacter sp.]